MQAVPLLSVSSAFAPSSTGGFTPASVAGDEGDGGVNVIGVGKAVSEVSKAVSFEVSGFFVSRSLSTASMIRSHGVPPVKAVSFEVSGILSACLRHQFQ